MNPPEKRSLSRFFSALVILLIALVPSISTANDGFGELGVGGIYLSKTNDISMRSELVNLNRSMRWG